VASPFVAQMPRLLENMVPAPSECLLVPNAGQGMQESLGHPKGHRVQATSVTQKNRI